MQVDYDNNSYQSCTAGMDGFLSRIDLQLSNLIGSPDAGRITLYREDNLSEPTMKTAIATGLLKGDGRALHPQEPLTRAELAVLLHLMLQQAGVIN